ncbi:MAG: hypothetical protein A3D35_02795 [Candidatus Staskawiczbacteria bacterium RIFCSPHIGHO2_02_FULL_34_9]|uniref:Uncharacterized protein n=1 Tax=Candidatus Staskawiczbacteria bacterium RIFCSPHIGHO2_02_FULL_34_9 TaxID=1802206 RepID=A0A1G2HX27_9BACT|nr:MAG: hypothetical protein A3D35_02795 [Candidatus Staskawiczbacteria bacterium RIFCSPHIGHO2_02_FULL_34_9]
MEKNIKMWIWAVVGIIILIALYFIFNNMQAPETNNETTTNTESVQDISSGDVGIAATSISYANALVKYSDRRIQLDTNCQAHPNMVNYKDNTGVMIDNRSPETLTVKIGTTFTIKPYGFKIVVLPDVYLASKTIFVDCNGSQNVATIVVQE